MRAVLTCLLVGLTTACGSPKPTENIDRVEMRLSGWSAEDVDVSRTGKGHYHLSRPLPQGRSGSFSIPTRQFAALVARLEPFRAQAVPLNDESARALIEQRCPPGRPRATDTGAIWVHWIGPGSNHHFLADL